MLVLDHSSDSLVQLKQPLTQKHLKNSLDLMVLQLNLSYIIHQKLVNLLNSLVLQLRRILNLIVVLDHSLDSLVQLKQSLTQKHLKNSLDSLVKVKNQLLLLHMLDLDLSSPLYLLLKLDLYLKYLQNSLDSLELQLRRILRIMLVVDPYLDSAAQLKQQDLILQNQQFCLDSLVRVMNLLLLHHMLVLDQSSHLYPSLKPEQYLRSLKNSLELLVLQLNLTLKHIKEQDLLLLLEVRALQSLELELYQMDLFSELMENFVSHLHMVYIMDMMKFKLMEIHKIGR